MSPNSSMPGLAGEGDARRPELRLPLKPIEHAHHMPGYVYASPEVFSLEKERLFMQDWLCIGRVEEVANPGDYLTHIVMGEPILISRDEKGELHACYNVCAHRGVEVAQGSGNTKNFKCPYHAWTYDLSGQLLGAPYMKQTLEFDSAACRLKSIRIGTWAGWIFVCFDADAEPLDRFIGFFEEEFGFLRMQDCQLAHKYVIDIECNWKFVYENLMDIYHVGTLHAKTIGRLQKEDSYRFYPQPRGRLAIHYEAGTMTPDGKSPVGKMPWLTDKDETFARIGFMPPNMNLLVRCDYARPFVHWPIAPDRTRSIAYFLFPKEKFAEPGFDEKVQIYVNYLTEVLEEDRDMVQSLQRAMSTRGFEPGRMSFLEKAIHHVVANHAERVLGR